MTDAALRAMKKTLLIAPLLALAMGACGHTVPAAPALSVTVVSSAEIEPGSAHRIVLEATACWMGAYWLGDPEPAARAKCPGALADAYGTVEPLRLARLRAADESEVEDLGRRVRDIAWRDPSDAAHPEELVTLLRAVGAAEHEQIRARRAARDAKADHTSVDVDALASSDALAALFATDAGDLSPEARTIAVMIAVERIGLASRLPDRYKVLVVEGAIHELFDLYPPPMPAYPSEKLVGGTWLAYLEDIAKAAKYPVPDVVTRPAYRETVAWGGMIAGMAEKLQTEKSQIREPNELVRAAERLRRRLEERAEATDLAIFASLLER